MKIQELLLKPLKETMIISWETQRQWFSWMIWERCIPQQAVSSMQMADLTWQNRSTSPIVPTQFLLQRKEESRGTDSTSIFLKLLLYIAIMLLHFLSISWNLWYRMSDPISLWPFCFGSSFANTLTSKWCFHSAKKRAPKRGIFLPLLIDGVNHCSNS